MAAESAAKRRRVLPMAESSGAQVAGGLIRTTSLGDLQAEGGALTPAARGSFLESWHADEAAVEMILPLVGELYRRNIIVSVAGRSLANQTAPDVLRLHHFAAGHVDPCITVHTTVALLKALKIVVSQPFRVDVGLLLVELKGLFDAHSGEELQQALITRLSEDLAKVEAVIQRPNPMDEARDVVLYGFGRIGRLLARILIQKTGAGVKILLRAIVVRPKGAKELLKRAYLLAQDSVHGRFPGTVKVDEANQAIIANGNVIHLIHAKAPEDVDYTAYGIKDAIIVDNTGVWRDAAGLSKHLKGKGVSKVVLTAPCKGEGVSTVVVGVNNDRVQPEQSLYSAASCTTNAIVPTLKVMQEAFGIESGHLETVHSFTNDQNLIDNYHPKARRGRAATLNMVLTETGAAKAVSKALPTLEGKLTGNAIRVPTPDVSMAILVLNLSKEVTVQEVNQALFEESTWGALHHQIGYSHDADAVSSDFIGEGHTGVVDGPATIAKGKRVNLYIWYDNEWGYSAQVVRLVQKIAGIEFPNFPLTLGTRGVGAAATGVAAVAAAASD